MRTVESRTFHLVILSAELTLICVSVDWVLQQTCDVSEETVKPVERRSTHLFIFLIILSCEFLSFDETVLLELINHPLEDALAVVVIGTAVFQLVDDVSEAFVYVLEKSFQDSHQEQIGRASCRER